jgi:hypothetical protein
MVWTIEAVVYEHGNTRLLEIVQLPAPRRALVTILDEPPVPQQLTGPSADAPMQEPLTVGTRIIDIAQVAEIADKGDYVFINFGLEHQPPYLHLTGSNAEAIRAWLRTQDAEDTQATANRLNAREISSLEHQARAGESIAPEHVLRLIAELQALRQDRDDVVKYSATVIQSLVDNCESLYQAFKDNKVRSVGCTLGEGCKVRADGSCDHTDAIARAAIATDDLPF